MLNEMIVVIRNIHNGVAIIIHKNINYSRVSTYFDNSLQNVCVRIKINSKEFNIISMYSSKNCGPIFTKNKINSLIKSVLIDCY